MVHIKHSFLTLALITTFLAFFSVNSLASDDPKFSHATDLFFSGQLDQSNKLLKELAENGNHDAYYYLALIAKRKGEAPTKALEYLKKAADAGNPEAMFKIGDMYANGEGVEKDLLKAMDWQRKSESFSYKSPPDIYYLPTDNNSTTPLAPSSILDSLIAEAKGGNLSSQYKVAKSYDFGLHGSKDGNKAIEWYQMAAKNGHSYSQLLLGYFFCRGIYVTKNIKQSNIWLSKSGSNTQCK